MARDDTRPAVRPPAGCFTARPARSGPLDPDRDPVSLSEWDLAVRLAVSAGAGAVLVWLFGMPLYPSSATPLAGVPMPVGSLFILGLMGIQPLRRRRRLQQSLRALVTAIFFAYGLPLLAAPFPADWRFVFYLAMTGATVALYEWSVVG